MNAIQSIVDQLFSHPMWVINEPVIGPNERKQLVLNTINSIDMALSIGELASYFCVGYDTMKAITKTLADAGLINRQGDGVKTFYMRRAA